MAEIRKYRVVIGVWDEVVKSLNDFTEIVSAYDAKDAVFQALYGRPERRLLSIEPFNGCKGTKTDAG